METKRFTRNPVEVEAVQVTPTNVAEVAEWCKGTLTEANYRLMGGSHKLPAIQLTKQGPGKDKTRVVMIGSWITKHKNVFKSWTREAFEAVYTEIKPALQTGDLVRGENDSPFYGWEGKVVDHHLIGVDFGARGMIVFQPEWLSKIEEMSSEQLELNAGVERDPEMAGVDPMTQVLNDMREESKERIAAMEAENLRFDEVIRVGDLVKIVKHPQLTQPPVNMGQCGHVRLIEDVPSADGPTKDYWVEFATADPEKPERVPYELVCLEKLRQDGEALNLEWEPPAPVAINDLRENLGMPRVPELEGVAADERAIENHRIIKESLDGMTPEEAAKIKEEIVGLQKIIGNAVDAVAFAGKPFSEQMEHFKNTDQSSETFEVEETAVRISKEQDISYAEALQKVVGQPLEELKFHDVTDEKEVSDVGMIMAGEEKPFATGDMIETLVAHEFDGVDIPFGTNGRVVVLDVDMQDGTSGVEVMFADGHYHSFRTGDIKKA